jgi:hypothetical protein
MIARLLVFGVEEVGIEGLWRISRIGNKFSN